MLSISNAECAEPPLPKIPPPPLPRSDPPPLPSTECPPLPSTAPPPLPTLPMHLTISVLSTALEPCQPDLKPPPPLPERSRDLLIDATSPHILTPSRTLRSPSPPIPPPSPLPPLPKVDLSVPPPLSAVVSSPENTQIPDSTRLVPPASNPPPELPTSHVDDSSQTFTHHTSLPSLDRPELDREALADVPSSLHGLVPVNVPRPSSPVSMLTPPSKVKEKDFAEPRRPKPRLKFGLNAPSYLSTQPTQPHTASFTFPSSNGSTPHPIPAIKPFTSLSRANTPSADHTDEFSIPSKLLTPLPPALAVLSAYPKSQGEVNQDFSKAKAPTNQVPIHQFQNWVNENYRVVEDETESVFRIPALGPHYSETWRAEDLGLPVAQVKAGSGLNALEGQVLPSVHPLAYPPLVQVKVEDVTDASLLTEKIEIGPLAERLISMIQPIGPHIRAEKETRKTDEPDDTRAGFMLGSDAPGSVALSSAEIVPRSEKPVKLDSLELEQRIIKELRYIGVLGNEEEVDWSLRADDEISMALRSTQKALRQQVAINTRRKARLSGIVKARMAFQEYETVKEGLDRVIEQGWNKRIRTDAKKKPASKRKLNKNQKNANGEDDDQEQPEVQSGVAQVRVPYSETLLAALEKRQVLIDNVSSIFQEGQGWGLMGEREFGRHLCMGIPTSTIYDDETEA
ncbi:hypothetical protein CROQUDRAFT_281246 [Cronartium quercuum f. sp. fusiforme G11]|uniref:Uncharacterized protein n=1 Tax=Cronartium quercuum f. sp. fusiforme G11 TaxID=708437 RepID=A0A9P6N9P7_9BASI|nr:hypothetical protein CROQUDRAFT_281246 [Cronartium quercuum f. sp. fusiforme G11]